MNIFFSVGEPSGDLHGSNLIRELKARDPSLTCVGYGGPRMAEAGCELHEDLTKLSVMWFLHVFRNILYFLRLLAQADRFLARGQTDAVILIDYPGFNWWIARKAKKYQIPVFYYGAPQMWAWAGWRIRKMRRLVDHVLCKLPFEADWYCERGCEAKFVGHPYFDEMAARVLDARFLAEQARQTQPLVTILPGSRTQEVEKHFGVFLEAAEQIQASVPEVRFAVASFNEQHATMVRSSLSEKHSYIDVHVGRTPELIESASCCMACSGSVSLELLYHEKPTVIYYRPSRFVYTIGRWLVLKVRYITLTNLLACEDRFKTTWQERLGGRVNNVDELPMPEFTHCQIETADLVRHLVHWLTDEVELKRRQQRLAALKTQVCIQGASATAAKYILDCLRDAAQAVGQPCAA